VEKGIHACKSLRLRIKKADKGGRRKDQRKKGLVWQTGVYFQFSGEMPFGRKGRIEIQDLLGGLEGGRVLLEMEVL